MTTTVSKFGASSLRVGGRQRVEVDPSSDFDFGLNDWSVDFWMLPVGKNHISPFAWYLNKDNYLSFVLRQRQGTKANLKIVYRQAGISIEPVFTNLFDLLNDTWQHAKLRLHNIGYDELVLTIGGVAISGHLYVPRPSFNLGTWPLFIGMGVDQHTHEQVAFDGFIDEFRIVTSITDNIVNTTPYVRAVVTNGTTYNKAYKNVAPQLSDYAGVGQRSINNTTPLYNKQYGANLVTDVTNHVARIAVSSTLNTYNGVNQRSINAGYTHSHTARGVVSARDNNYTSWHSTTVHASFTDSEKQYTAVVQNDSNFHRALLPINAIFIDNHRTENTAVALYELYHELGTLPDFVTPLDTSNTLPVVSSAISGEGIHYFVLRKRNKYNQVSRNIEAVRIELDASDNELIIQPVGPLDISSEITNAGLFEVTVEANYNHGADHDLAADQWVVYSSNTGIIDVGSWPEDGSNPQTITVDMEVVDGFARIKQTMTVLTLAGYLVGVRTRRSSDGRLSSTIQKLHVQSTTAGGGGGTPIPPVPEFVQ